LTSREEITSCVEQNRRKRVSVRHPAWWCTFAIFTVLGSLWALASPLFSVPDEPAHAIRAVAASRGQILPGERTSKQYSTYVEVPGVFKSASGVPSCYAFKKNATAGCEAPLTGSRKPTPVETNAGLYPPAYYAVAGLPSLPFPSATGVYLMRIWSAALCAALLASALASVWLLPASRLVVAAIAVAVTPMVLFLVGSVNPNGIEIAAAVCFWATLAVLLVRPDDRHLNRLFLRAGVAGTVLGLSRLGSPLWVVLIVGAVLAWAGWERAWTFLRDRRAWLVGAAVGLSSLCTLLWVRHYGTLRYTLGGAPGGTLDENIRLSLGNADTQIDRMIGVFGWLDTRSATFSSYLWLFALGALVLLGLAAAGRRQALVLVGLVVAVVVVPVALEAPRAGTQGFPWQGRYTLPLAVGVPILAALQVDRSSLLSAPLTRRLSAVLLGAFGVGQLYAHVWATRRYTAGVDGAVDWITAGGWNPPLPVWTLFVAFVGALAAAALWLQWTAAQSSERLQADSLSALLRPIDPTLQREPMQVAP
jgi:hypothetical protein